MFGWVKSADRLGSINSPTLAMPQKQMVMHMKRAASRGSSGLSWNLKRVIMSGVKGSCWGCLMEGGARQAAPSVVAFKVSESRSHDLPCSMCQVWTSTM